MTDVVVFDLVQHGLQCGPAIAAALAALVALVVCVVLTKLFRPFSREWWRSFPFAMLAFVFLLADAGDTYGREVAAYRHLLEAYNARQYVVVEGAISHMNPLSLSNRLGSFDVGGRHFAFTEAMDAMSFNGRNGALYVLRDGDLVRVYAVGPDIIRLELDTRHHIGR